jgi:hypothetical protein
MVLVVKKYFPLFETFRILVSYINENEPVLRLTGQFCH